MENSTYTDKLKSIFGKTIAIIYIFEGDKCDGYRHYEIWKSDVISSWMFAVEELKGLPLIMDLRTFVQKAINKTLPYIDYVINLNNGTISLSTLGLLPSICSFLNIPCIPCDTISIISGEHKRISNIIANSIGIKIPKNLPTHINSGITRPISLGSSLGVQRDISSNFNEDEFLYQEFIPGFDMTTPILYNPISNRLDILPAVLYYPDEFNPEWFLGKTEKVLHRGYKKKIVHLSDDVKNKYLKLAKMMNIKCYCRIDARVICNSKADYINIVENTVTLDKIYFLEINPMPTIKNGINFHTSMDSLTKEESLYNCYQQYMNTIPKATDTGFILSCSMLSLSTTKH